MPPAACPACFPALAALAPRRRDGVIEFPVHHMRGGTSTGLVLWDRFAPAERALKDELLRHLMGLPLEGTRKGNRQITGLGRGGPTSNKVFFADLEADGTPRLVSTLAQLASDTAAIDWSVNCGNMSAALPLWALDTGLLSRPAGAGRFETVIRNTNTGVLATARMGVDGAGRPETAEIPGVDGAFPAVDLSLADPVGAKTGRLLPTGRRTDQAGGVTVLDDYAHHPTEIAAVLQAARELHPHRLLAVFQPQRYARTKLLFVEFAQAFALADDVLLLDIYAPPGEQPIAGISSAGLARSMEAQGTRVQHVHGVEEAQAVLSGRLQTGDLVLVMGAGDIYRLAQSLGQAVEGRLKTGATGG